jgi:hypothetical protein
MLCGILVVDMSFNQQQPQQPQPQPQLQQQQRRQQGGGGGLLGGVLGPVTDTLSPVTQPVGNVLGGATQGLGKALSNIGESSANYYDPSGISLYRQRMEREWPLPPHPRYKDLERIDQNEQLLHQIVGLLQALLQQQGQR